MRYPKTKAPIILVSAIIVVASYIIKRKFYIYIYSEPTRTTYDIVVERLSIYDERDGVTLLRVVCAPRLYDYASSICFLCLLDVAFCRKVMITCLNYPYGWIFIVVWWGMQVHKQSHFFSIVFDNYNYYLDCIFNFLFIYFAFG